MRWVLLAAAVMVLLPSPAQTQARVLTMEEAVAVANAHNPDIAIARENVQAARGGVREARAGFLPAVVSTGLLRLRKHQTESRLRDEDYSASLRVVQNLYTGGGVSNQLAISKLKVEIRELELQATSSRVAMEVRIAFDELLLNRAKIGVREQSAHVLEGEVKSQQERLNAGIVGPLELRRAEVALANEQPDLIDAQTLLQNSYLRLGELLGVEGTTTSFEVKRDLQFQPGRPKLEECLARAAVERPEIKARQKEIEIEDRQAEVDRSALRPQVEAFSGYELYNERDPLVGREFNHGYVVGLNARWNIFDGFATKGRLQATQARRKAAVQTLKSTQLSIASEVRSAFFDFEQANHILEAESKNVQSAAESLEIAKANLGAGLGTQLDILQAAAAVTGARTTRLSAIFQHNVALAKLARACAVMPDSLTSPSRASAARKGANSADLDEPSPRLSQP